MKDDETLTDNSNSQMNFSLPKLSNSDSDVVIKSQGQSSNLSKKRTFKEMEKKHKCQDCPMKFVFPCLLRRHRGEKKGKPYPDKCTTKSKRQKTE